jgi:hypothetical protein
LADERIHSLRYVLKNRETDETLFVVVFSLIPKDGHEKPEPTKEAAPAAAPSTNDDDVD